MSRGKHDLKTEFLAVWIWIGNLNCILVVLLRCILCFTQFFLPLTTSLCFCFYIAAPIPPMRYTKRCVNGLELQDTANILTVKIVSSDKGFPIDVYGTIIARDSIDHKCMYLFNRTRDNCQPIKSRVRTSLLQNHCLCASWFYLVCNSIAYSVAGIIGIWIFII